VAGDDMDLRSLLETLDPRVATRAAAFLILDQADRDAISWRLLRDRDQNGDDWADIIDVLPMHPDARRKVARLLGEIDAE
jgi:hypothetical protein